MKISEMITEEMVRGIRSSTPASTNIMIGDDCLILLAVNISGGEDSRIAKEYDLDHFLFVDAWDYFIKKKWTILNNGHDGILVARGASSNILWCKNYPSRLHAMAAAVVYMWEQEAKQ